MFYHIGSLYYQESKSRRQRNTCFPVQTLGSNVYFVFPGTFSSVLHLLPLYLYKLLIKGGCVS